MRAFLLRLSLGAGLGLVLARLLRRRRSSWSIPSHATAAAEQSSAGADVLNTATREQLLAVYGIGPALAEKIIIGRPYNSERELLDRRITSESVFESLKRDLLGAA